MGRRVSKVDVGGDEHKRVVDCMGSQRDVLVALRSHLTLNTLNTLNPGPSGSLSYTVVPEGALWISKKEWLET
jgi:hypothetical protein